MGPAGSYVKWMPALLLQQRPGPNDDQPYRRIIFRNISLFHAIQRKNLMLSRMPYSTVTVYLIFDIRMSNIEYRISNQLYIRQGRQIDYRPLADKNVLAIETPRGRLSLLSATFTIIYVINTKILLSDNFILKSRCLRKRPSSVTQIKMYLKTQCT